MKKRYIPYPEKEFPVGKIIGIIALIIVIITIALLASNSSDNSSKNPAKFTKTVSSYPVTQNPDGSVTLTADAKEKTEALIPYKKGQKITFTATGTITGSTNPRDGANRDVGPEGWSCEPGFLRGRQKMLQSAPFMGLLGKLENGEWFYIGRGTSITTKTSGEENKILAQINAD